MSKPIINIDDIDMQPWPAGASIPGPVAERYDATMGFIAPRIGAQKLGYNITAVPPGKSAFPLHNNHVNEEMFLILEGEGEVRIGAERHSIHKGDVIACPPGGPEAAHQIINTSETAELRYLAVSTKQTPEIAKYPDSGKFGILAEFPPGPDGKPGGLRFVSRPELSVDYWEGE